MKFPVVAITFLLATLPFAVTGFSLSPSSSSSSKWGYSSTKVYQSTRRTTLVMKEGSNSNKEPFSLATLFGGSNEKSEALKVKTKASLRGNKKLEAHPSVRPHISPLNRLTPNFDLSVESDPLPVHPQVKSGVLDNGMPYIILPNKSPPGRFEAHLQVFSGSGTLSRFFFSYCLALI